MQNNLIRKSLIIGIFILFVGPTIASAFYENLTNKPIPLNRRNILDEYSDNIWPLHKYNPQRTGRSRYDTSQNKGGIKWKTFINAHIYGSATIDKNGTIYVASIYNNSFLYAIYPNGTIKWKTALADPAHYELGYEYQAPTIAPDGTIYVGTMSYFYAFYPNGTRKWKSNIKANFFTNPVIDSQGIVYVSTQEGYLYMIYSNGTTKLKINVSDYTFDIALDKGENIYYYGYYNNSLTCLNPNGSIKWVHSNEVNIWSGPVIGDDGTIYISGDHMTALYPNGTLKWKIDYTNFSGGSPSIAPDGTIILCEYPGEYVTALNPINHSIIWQYRIGDTPQARYVSEATIGADGTIYFGYTAYNDCIAFVCALNPNGSLKWETSLTTDFFPNDGMDSLTNPSIGNDGTVYITATFVHGDGYPGDGYVYAIGKDNATTPNPPSIKGSTKITLLKKYNYTLSCALPAGEEVYYLVDWDDEGISVIYDNNWIGPFSSETEVIVNHTWLYWGKHAVKVKVRNSDGLCSPWATLEVKTRLLIFFEWLFERFPNAFPILRYLLKKYIPDNILPIKEVIQ